MVPIANVCTVNLVLNSTVNQTVAIVSNVFQVRFSTPATSVHVLQELTNPTDNVYLVLILTVSVAHLHKNVSSVLRLR